MRKVIPKTIFLFAFFLFLSFQTSLTHIHVPPFSPRQSGNILDEAKYNEGKNQERTDEMLRFTSEGHTLGFRKGDVVIASEDHALRIELVDARSISPVAEKITLDTEKNPKTAKPLGMVTYRNLWDGVTLVYERHSSGVVKSTYTVQPFGSGSSSPVERIRLRYNVPVEVDGDGSLVFSFETGKMRESRPLAWQEIKGRRQSVDVSFRPLGQHEVGFKVGSYDSRFPLVIDPVLTWHTFMGSSSGDYGIGIAMDGSGNVYVTGYSYASWGTPIDAHSGSWDAFVAKLDSNGARLWSTFMGSSSSDFGLGIAVDGIGNVYVTGYSYASWGTPINAHAGDSDVFVAKLDSNGVRQWNTFMGSSSGDSGLGIAVDGIGNVYVTGYSRAAWGTPINAYVANREAFVAKLNSSGIRQWNTFMGSSSDDSSEGITLDSSDNAYVTGRSDASWGTPINAHSGDYDAFVAKLDSNGIRQWNTFMGSSNIDAGQDIVADGNGNVCVTGYSYASWGIPASDYAGFNDAFVVKLDSNGTRQWNTFMGSSSYDYGWGITVDRSGNIFVTGSSSKTWGNPINEFDGECDSYPCNAFAAKLNSIGIRQWNTFMRLGYSPLYVPDSSDIAVDGKGNVYVTGISWSDWWGTPVNPFSGGGDAFVAKIFDTSIYVFDGHDFNGNGSTDASVFRPSNGKWYLKGIGSYFWGGAGDIPVNGDYNGDGTTDVAVWRPSNGKWYLRGIGEASWGGPSDIPVPGNYNGDINGTTDIAVWRPSNGRWYIKGVGGLVWGTAGDIPVPGDYNGDGKTDIAVWRPSNGKWYIKGVIGLIWGGAADIPVPADYNGDGKTDIAVWRPSNGRWYIKGVAGSIWGAAGDVPVPGDYNGDGKTDIAVWRPSNGKWYIKGIGGYIWGVLGDIPLVR